METINSLNNSRIKELERLRQTHKQRAAGLFIIDGYRETTLAQTADWEILEIFYCSELATINNNPLNLQGIITRVSRQVFQKICYKEKPDGFLAVAKRRKTTINEIKLQKKALVLVLEAVEKPGNLGAIIRTAYAAGVDVVILNDNQTDIFNFNVIRASEGLVFKQLIVQADFTETLSWLKTNQIKVWAAATEGKKLYSQASFIEAVAIVLGSEAKGLSKDWLEASQGTLKLPMQAGIDSLNVSVSAGIIIYEVLRQRAQNKK